MGAFRKYPPGFTVGHCGHARQWSVTLPTGDRVTFPVGTLSSQVHTWCWEQHRRLRSEEVSHGAV